MFVFNHPRYGIWYIAAATIYYLHSHAYIVFPVLTSTKAPRSATSTDVFIQRVCTELPIKDLTIRLDVNC